MPIYDIKVHQKHRIDPYKVIDGCKREPLFSKGHLSMIFLPTYQGLETDKFTGEKYHKFQSETSSGLGVLVERLRFHMCISPKRIIVEF